MTLFRIEISFMDKQKFLISKKLRSDMYFKLQQMYSCILVRLWVKVLVSEGWMQSKITAQTL